MEAIRVREKDEGGYEWMQGFPVVDWATVREDADSVSKIRDLHGWGEWKAAYRVTNGDCEYVYLVNPPPKTITIAVENVTDLMLLRQSMGQGTMGDLTFEIDTIMNTASPVVTIYEGDERTAYMVQMTDIVRAIVEMHRGKSRGND